MKKFGQRLKVLREEKDLKQDELGEKLGLSKSAIGMYERGEREPKSLDLLKQIATFFDVSVSYITGESDERGSAEKIRYDVTSSTPDLKKILRETTPHWGGKQLTKRDADMIIDFYESVLRHNKIDEEKS